LHVKTDPPFEDCLWNSLNRLQSTGWAKMVVLQHIRLFSGDSIAAYLMHGGLTFGSTSRRTIAVIKFQNTPDLNRIRDSLKPES